MAVSWNSKHKLLKRDTSCVPLLDRADGRRSLVGGLSAGIIERCVGADASAPGSPDVVVHEGDIVEDFGKASNTGRGSAIGVIERRGSSGSRDNDFGSGGVLPEFLKEQ